MHAQTKHISIQHHQIWKKVEDGTVAVQYISSNNQQANLLTKSLSTTQFIYNGDLEGLTLLSIQHLQA